MNISYLRMIKVLLVSGVLFTAVLLAQDEGADFHKAREIEPPAKRIEALRQFVDKYPESERKGQAYSAMFRDYLELENVPEALEAAEKYLATMPENRRGSAYNFLAWTLAEHRAALDKAEEYAALAVEWARSQNSLRRLTGILDTQAFVLYQKGDVLNAEKIQLQAMNGNEDDPDFLGRLAVYQEAAGKPNQALKTAVRALLFDGDEEIQQHFDHWLEKQVADSRDRLELKEKIVSETVETYLAEITPEAQTEAHVRAARLMAKTAVQLPRAERWAEEALSTLDERSELSKVIQYRVTLGTVYYARGKHQNALAVVEPVKDLAEPWDTDFWYMLGQVYENTGQMEKAIDSYIQGLVVIRPEKLMNSLETVYTRLHGDSQGLEQQIAEVKAALLNFNPGQYQPSSTPSGRVVLAELFTGSECPPCQAADYAFDALREYFPRHMVAILEYHLHIPRPDPMTNNSTEAAYRFYGANFGTPTVFINGTEKMTGGGPKIVAKNRFTVYQRAIQNKLNRRSALAINGTINLVNDALQVYIEVKSDTPDISPQTPARLKIALVERSVEYEGSNGVDHHAFVVRKLLEGPEGIAVNSQKGIFKIKRSIELKSIENELNSFLDEYAAANASRFRDAEGWKVRPEKLRRDNLAVVAWVQDPLSREVLQAFYEEVPGAPAAR